MCAQAQHKHNSPGRPLQHGCFAFLAIRTLCPNRQVAPLLPSSLPRSAPVHLPSAATSRPTSPWPRPFITTAYRYAPGMNTPPPTVTQGTGQPLCNHCAPLCNDYATAPLPLAPSLYDFSVPHCINAQCHTALLRFSRAPHHGRHRCQAEAAMCWARPTASGAAAWGQNHHLAGHCPFPRPGPAPTLPRLQLRQWAQHPGAPDRGQSLQTPSGRARGPRWCAVPLPAAARSDRSPPAKSPRVRLPSFAVV